MEDEMAAEPEDMDASDGDVVAYIGTSDVRVISAEAWAGIKIKGGDRAWNASNRKEISVSEFTDDELAFLQGEEDFEVRAASPVPEPPVAAPDPAQHYE